MRCGTPPRRTSAGRQPHEHRATGLGSTAFGGAPRMPIGNRGHVRADGRGPGDLRPVEITLGVQKWAEGSCLIRVGDTEVLCAATIEDRVPPHLRGKGTGWVTGEYSMLPRATAERTEREIGEGPDRRADARDPAPRRALAARASSTSPGSASGPSPSTATSSQADGGTRTASITGGYVALAAALITYGMERHLVGTVAAVSVGHRRRRQHARPRLLGGLPGRGGLQRRRHGRRARTSSSRARRRASRSTGRRSTRCSTSRTRASAACSRPRRRRWRRCAASGGRTPSDGAPAASLVATRSRHKLRELGELLACRPDVELLALDDLGIDGRAGGDRRDVRDQRPDQGALLRVRRPVCRRWPTTPGSRWTRSAAGPASGRAATPARTRPTRTTTRSCCASWRGCRPSGAARGTSACWPSRCRTSRGRAAALRIVARRGHLPRAHRHRAARGTGGFGYDPHLRAGAGAARAARTLGPVVGRREARDLASLPRCAPHGPPAPRPRVLRPIAEQRPDGRRSRLRRKRAAVPVPLPEPRDPAQLRSVVLRISTPHDAAAVRSHVDRIDAPGWLRGNERHNVPATTSATARAGCWSMWSARERRGCHRRAGRGRPAHEGGPPAHTHGDRDGRLRMSRATPARLPPTRDGGFRNRQLEIACPTLQARSRTAYASCCAVRR